MKLGVTAHAIERYQERVKPALGLGAARRELIALVKASSEVGPKPDWLHLPENPTRATDLYLTLSDGVVAALKEKTVVSVITRSGSNELHRANKNRGRAKRRAARRKLPYRPGRGREALPRWR